MPGPGTSVVRGATEAPACIWADRASLTSVNMGPVYKAGRRSGPVPRADGSGDRVLAEIVERHF